MFRHDMPTLPEHRVLIVEDEPSVRWLLAIAFDRQGIQSDVAESGREAVVLQFVHNETHCIRDLAANPQ